jgi:elongation factor P--beta-lysine ligase
MEYWHKENFLITSVPFIQWYYQGGNPKWGFQISSQNYSTKQLFLKLTSEIDLRALLSSGLDKVFSITKSFRDIKDDSTSLNEFHAFELLEANIDIESMQKKYFNFLAKILHLLLLQKDWFATNIYEDSVKDLLSILEKWKMREILYEDALVISGNASYEWVLDSVRPLSQNEMIILVNLPVHTSPTSKRIPHTDYVKERIYIYKWVMIWTVTETENDFWQLQNNIELQELFFLENGYFQDTVYMKAKLLEILRFWSPQASGIWFWIESLMNFLLGSEDIRTVNPFLTF